MYNLRFGKSMWVCLHQTEERLMSTLWTFAIDCHVFFQSRLTVNHVTVCHLLLDLACAVVPRQQSTMNWNNAVQQADDHG